MITITNSVYDEGWISNRGGDSDDGLLQYD